MVPKTVIRTDPCGNEYLVEIDDGEDEAIPVENWPTRIEEEVER